VKSFSAASPLRRARWRLSRRDRAAHSGLRLHRRIATVSLLAAAMLASGYWALAPLPEPAIPQAALPPSKIGESPRDLAALDQRPFQLRLFLSQPSVGAGSAVTAPPPPPPPVPPRLQLLAILHDEPGPDGYRAMIYDPGADKVLVVGAGERIGSQTVQSVDALSLHFTGDSGEHVLALRAEGDRP
jgi:hypothetical protein